VRGSWRRTCRWSRWRRRPPRTPARPGLSRRSGADQPLGRRAVGERHRVLGAATGHRRSGQHAGRHAYQAQPVAPAGTGSIGYRVNVPSGFACTSLVSVVRSATGTGRPVRAASAEARDAIGSLEAFGTLDEFGTAARAAYGRPSSHACQARRICAPESGFSAAPPVVRSAVRDAGRQHGARPAAGTASNRRAWAPLQASGRYR